MIKYCFVRGLGRTELLQRNQRARRRPNWLSNTVDPKLVDPINMVRPQRPFSAYQRYNVRTGRYGTVNVSDVLASASSVTVLMPA